MAPRERRQEQGKSERVRGTRERERESGGGGGREKKRLEGVWKERGRRGRVARVEDKVVEKEETRRTGEASTVGGQIQRTSGSQSDGLTLPSDHRGTGGPGVPEPA